MKKQYAMEQIAVSDIRGEDQPSWNQPRSTEQLLGFISRHEAAISGYSEEA